MAGLCLGLLVLVTFASCAFINPVVARNSPHKDFVMDFLKRTDQGRYSDNLLEDAQLDVPGLIAKYKYPVEIHNVVTEDGYVLEMHRIPFGRDKNKFYDPTKPVVLLLHGLFASSADFVFMGPKTALAYILADEGYDVWLGNARGNYYSRHHLTLDPDDPETRNNFWRFSWEEIGLRDLPSMIDHILEKTAKRRIHYIGHSQGNTAFWVMASLKPEYNAKIISMHAYAPVAYWKHIENPVIEAIAPYLNILGLISRVFGINELYSNSEFFTRLGQDFCADGLPTQFICSNIIFYFGGRNEDLHNATMFPVQLAHWPAGSSVRQVVHYGQLIGKEFFRRYDHGPLSNMLLYKSFSPPQFNLSQITAPVFLHHATIDPAAHLKDVEKLWRELGRPIGKFCVPHPKFSHYDFVWGTRTKELLYDKTIDLMRALGNS